MKGNDNSIPFEYIQEKIGLPFCMNELETIHMLQELSSKYANYLQYSDVAGIRQVQFIKPISIQQVLDNYYGTEI